MKLLRVIFHRRVLAVLGLIAVALLIWFIGPLIAIATWRPLEPEWVRHTIIGLILLFYAGRALWQVIKARRANAQLAQALVERPLRGAPAGPTPGSEEVAELRRRFEEAITVLKTTKQRKSGKAATLFGSQFLYELPWYMFIGAPGSGKTTALVHSGLHFPLADRFGHELAGVGGTRNCDWYFTDQAVLIDTAGRYTTQESDREADHAAWTGFLDLLKKHRPRRPINGAIVTVSVADLLQAPSELELQARAIRARIQELHEQLNVRFPLYVMVSKADLLPGFMDFFAEYGREDREQVWGTTFALSERGGDVLVDFEDRFKALEQRLNDRLVARLQQERDPQTRAAIYALPQHFSTLKEPLQSFLRNVFTPSRFEEQPLVRGLYFTSGTQEGSPIDRIVGGLARAFRLERKVLPPQRPTGKSFFITRLFTNVIFPEAGIAGTNLRWERQRLALQWASFALAGLVTAGLVTAWSISYARNNNYLHEVQEKLNVVTEYVAALRQNPSHNQLVELLPTLRSVQTLAITDSVATGVPPSMQYGLYQGEKLQDASSHAYRKLLRDVFMPRVAFRVEDQLRSRQQNLELLYEALKAYIMLTDRKHFDPKAVKAFVTAEWENNLPREVTVEQRNELEAHLDALLALPDLTMPIPPDNELIKATRATISRIPTAQRVYNRIKLQHASTNLPELTLAKAGGDQVLLVFRRVSGEPPTRGVPGFFSYDGYHKLFRKAADVVTAQLAQEEPWVLGVQRTMASRLTDPLGSEQLRNDVRRLYLEEYVRVWDKFINDIKLVPVRDLDQSVALTNILSSPDSPMHLLLRAIVRETTLIDEKEKSTMGKAADVLSESKTQIGKFFGAPGAGTGAAAARPESIVDDHFAHLRRMVRSAPGQQAPIDTAAALMKDANAQLVAAQAALKQRTQPPPSNIATQMNAEAARMPEPLRSAFSGIGAAAGRQVAQKTRETVSDSLESTMRFCHQAIEGRYPFTKTSKLDVTRDDFARLFAPNGVFDDFFQKQLAPIVDTSTSPWRIRGGGDAPLINAAGLAQFQRARTIRDVFFHGAATPTLRLEFKPVSLDASITQLIIDFDGQILRYSHGPQIPTLIQWPGQKGTSQIRIEVSPPSPTGNPSGQVFDGPWALLRMLDRAQLQHTNHPDKMMATWNIDGRKAQFEISSASVQNPMRLTELQQFRCPTRL